MPEPESLVRYERETKNLERADFSQKNHHVSIKYGETDYWFEWLTSEDFYDVAELIDQEYPIRNRVDFTKSSDLFEIENQDRDYLRKTENPHRYKRATITFEDFTVTWEGYQSDRRVDEPHQIKIISEGAGLWPFEHLYGETVSLEEDEVLSMMRDIEQFLGFHH